MFAKYWRHQLVLVAGGWMLLSPWVMDYYHLRDAAWNAVFMGYALMLSQVVAFARPGIWEELAGIAIGCYLVASPLILGFTSNLMVAYNAAFVGTVVILLAALGLGGEANIQRWWHDHMRHTH